LQLSEGAGAELDVLVQHVGETFVVEHAGVRADIRRYVEHRILLLVFLFLQILGRSVKQPADQVCPRLCKHILVAIMLVFHGVRVP